VVHDLIRLRRLTLFSVGASLLALGLVFLQGLVIGSQGSGVTGYMTQLAGIGPRNFYNLFLAIKNLGRLTFGETPGWWSYPLFAFTMAAALVGLHHQLKRGLSYIHLVAACYLGVLFVFPHQPTRYLFVILPLFLLWVLMGLQVVGERLGRRAGWALALFLLVTVFISYGFRYYQFIGERNEPQVTDPAALEVYQYLEEKTDESSRIMFSNPRVLTFFTGRESSVWHCGPARESLLAYMKRIKATHLVLPLWKPECIEDLIREHPRIFQEKMSNDKFKIFIIDTDSLPSSQD
jgi:hypothetical protein